MHNAHTLSIIRLRVRGDCRLRERRAAASCVTSPWTPFSFPLLSLSFPNDAARRGPFHCAETKDVGGDRIPLYFLHKNLRPSPSFQPPSFPRYHSSHLYYYYYYKNYYYYNVLNRRMVITYFSYYYCARYQAQWRCVCVPSLLIFSNALLRRYLTRHVGAPITEKIAVQNTFTLVARFSPTTTTSVILLLAFVVAFPRLCYDKRNE